MSSIRRRGRLGAFAGGALLVGLSVAGFTGPVPLPTVSPAVPVPSPSIPVVSSLLSPSTGGDPAATGSQPSGQSPAATAARPGRGVLGTASGVLQPAAGDQTGVAAARDIRLTGPADGVVNAPSLTGLPATGGAGPAGPGAPPPALPGVLAGVVLALFFFSYRMSSRGAGSRRYHVHVEFSAPTGLETSAAAAVRCLLESGLPTGVRVRSRSSAAFLVDAPMLQRAVLGAGLADVAARARRVGLALDWKPETLGQDQADREPVVALRAYRLQGG